MLFAFSFDTISQATLFALAAGRFGGVPEALLVAGLFVLGMLVVDGINGVWISRLIRRADRTAVIASRVMALTVAGISLAVGCFTVAKLLPSRRRCVGGRARNARRRRRGAGRADGLRRRHDGGAAQRRPSPPGGEFDCRAATPVAGRWPSHAQAEPGARIAVTDRVGRYLRYSGEMSFGRNRMRSGQMIVRDSTPSIGISMMMTSFSTYIRRTLAIAHEIIRHSP